MVRSRLRRRRPERAIRPWQVDRAEGCRIIRFPGLEPCPAQFSQIAAVAHGRAAGRKLTRGRPAEIISVSGLALDTLPSNITGRTVMLAISGTVDSLAGSCAAQPPGPWA